MSISVSHLQHRASDPKASAWVSANAGSGKTFVLTQRVVRLLLDGVAPSKILCLTFTKAAAANMSIRVFKLLSTWTHLDNAQLREAILETGAPEPDAAQLVHARRLFARTVETPGGLKIQTIHAFCERLLHLFPFEANVAAGFEVMDEAHAAEVMAKARQDVFAMLPHSPTSDLARAVAVLTDQASLTVFEEVLEEALRHRRTVRNLSQTFPTPALLRAHYAGVFDVDAHEDEAHVDRLVLQGGILPSRWLDVAAVFATGSKSEVSTAELMQQAHACHDIAQKVALYQKIFLTDKSLPRAKLMTNGLATRFPALHEELQAEQARLVGLVERRRRVATVARSVALVQVADAMFNAYAQAKHKRGLLDYDDLTERTASLLARADSSWVLYKLDAGIDHILIDEAQDTSPEQWEILQALTSDFLSGETARNVPRTVFAVGDEKQSIYSFQGAAPHQFQAMQDAFALRHRQANKAFQPVTLKTSFRSSPAILAPIDAVFAEAPNRTGLSANHEAPLHHAWKKDLPGLVEIWPLQQPEPLPEPRDWRLPLDAVHRDDPPVRLAKRIAQTIAGWLQPGALERVHNRETPRPIHAGDILILVRSRGAFFEAINRALKDVGVPVAGADRLKLAAHIGVQDLLALGHVCLLPSDDLTLACVLKSPLLGLDDTDLMALAPKRLTSLWDALQSAENLRHQEAFAKLLRWKQAAQDHSPFAFYARVLGADRGRHLLVSRLGAEVHDALDEFLRDALTYESEETASLTGFLKRYVANEKDIKRDMDGVTAAVRVMTVHAAKGLEAKIVFLPDTCGAATGKHDSKILDLPTGPHAPHILAWSKGKQQDPAPLQTARDSARTLQEQEHRRLLYVAMTRAEERLYIAGFHGVQGPGEGCWYHMIRTALGPQMTPMPDPAGDILRLSSNPWPPQADTPGDPKSASGTQVQNQADLPIWLSQPAPAEPRRALPLNPSNVLERDANSWEPQTQDEADARLSAATTGRLVHALLQYVPGVPAPLQAAAALRFLALRAPALETEQHAALWHQVSRVLSHADLAPLFGPGARAEVAVAGDVQLGAGCTRRVVGQIDRLVDTGDAILFVDFKTGAHPRHRMLPKPILLQLALYQAALQPLWPTRRVRGFVVWTQGPLVVEAPASALQAALTELVG